LAAAGLTVRRERSSHGFARLTVVAGDDATELDLAADARIRPVDPGPLGPMLSAEELGADKLLALFDRAQARDFVDVAALVDRFGLDRLCELASEKDAGLSRSVLVEMLGSFDRFRPDEFGMSMSAYGELARAVEQWRQRLSISHPTEPSGPGLGL
jgi:Nucleotidyl transferase AbiEii toxin, Type IV TA system